jgi:hypothetical protein
MREREGQRVKRAEKRKRPKRAWAKKKKEIWARGKNWKNQLRKRKEWKLGLGPINLDTQGPTAPLLWTPIKAQLLKPNPNWAPLLFTSPIRFGPPMNPKPN